MGKFHERTGLIPLEELPYFVKTFVVVGLLMGPAGFCGILLNGATAASLGCILFGIAAVLLWRSVSEPGRSSAPKQVPTDSNIEADDSTGTEDAGRSSVSVKQVTVRQAPSPQKIVIGEPNFCPGLMSGQLVARYKKTHDKRYQDEYRRRLQSLGFSEQEAELMFMYELMTLKHFAIDGLCRDDYLHANVFDMKKPVLTLDDSYYVKHQSFLCSQIVKIWDEAEWRYWNSHESDMPDEVWSEIFRLSRYGGGKLFVDYLTSMAERSSVPLDKVQRYSVAEQQLLFTYKWNAGKGEKHPYAA